jgi:hypothetical protein
VIVYATFRSWHCSVNECIGDLVVSSATITGLIKRSLAYHISDQAARSYNSENMNLPITPGMTESIEAKLVAPAELSDDCVAAVQIVGYART